MPELAIIYRDPTALTPNPRNARLHSEEQIRKIARSIKRFGFNNPVMVDADGMILCGHGRVLAAKNLGLSSVPTVRLDHMTPEQRRAYVLADNKLGDESSFDRGTLAIELQEILHLPDLEFEISDIGFEIPEIDLLLQELHATDEQEQAPPEPGSVPAVARLGDLWLLGPHRLFCGNALDELTYRVLMGNERARMVFTDPPYNCRINGNVSGTGKHREFVMASGEMTDAEFSAFLRTVLGHLATYTLPASIHYVCMDWRQITRLIEAAAPVFGEPNNLCVWNKGHGAMGSFYRSQHELVAVFQNGRGKYVNNIQLGKHGRNRTNVWSYRGMSGFQKNRAKTLAAHSTVKPTALVADAMLDCSNPGDLILDPFAGSGTIFLAADRANRRGFGIELDPLYVDVALHRFRDATGIEPVNAWAGATLASALAPGRRRLRELSPAGR